MPGMFDDILETDGHTILTKLPNGKYKVEQRRLSRRELERRLEDYVNASAEMAEMFEFVCNLHNLNITRIKTLMALRSPGRPAAPPDPPA